MTDALQPAPETPTPRTEKTLTEFQKETYEAELCLAERSRFDVLHATASQRAEAFLRTLNLWTT
jgi:hypothetical protein